MHFVTLSRYCRTMLARGILWSVLAIAIFAQPALSLGSLTLLLGTVLLTDGVLTLANVAGERERRQARWAGFIGIAMGVLAFWIRSISAPELLYYLGSWGVLTGSIEIIAALRNGKRRNSWLLLAGLAGLAFGVLVLLRAHDSRRSAPALIGICALAFAIILFTLALGAHVYMKRVLAPRSNGAARTRA